MKGIVKYILVVEGLKVANSVVAMIKETNKLEASLEKLYHASPFIEKTKANHKRKYKYHR